MQSHDVAKNEAASSAEFLVKESEVDGAKTSLSPRRCCSLIVFERGEALGKWISLSRACVCQPLPPSRRRAKTRRLPPALGVLQYISYPWGLQTWHRFWISKLPKELLILKDGFSFICRPRPFRIRSCLHLRRIQCHVNQKTMDAPKKWKHKFWWQNIRALSDDWACDTCEPCAIHCIPTHYYPKACRLEITFSTREPLFDNSF